MRFFLYLFGLAIVISVAFFGWAAILFVRLFPDMTLPLAVVLILLMALAIALVSYGWRTRDR